MTEAGTEVVLPDGRTLVIMSEDALAEFPNPDPDVRLPYGDDPLQFGDLRLPDGPGPHPVIVLIHGGCWLSDYDIAHIGKLADAFTNNGFATWAIEYRRVGNPGGGWPGTFEDVAAATDHLLKMADEYSLDTRRVITVGHSAGGHLALWLAARNQLQDTDLFRTPDLLKLKGVLALAPAADLAFLHKTGVCEDVVDKLMGGSPQEVPERYAAGSVTALVPIGLPQVLLVGRHDEGWLPVGLHHFEVAKAVNDNVRLIEAEESGHFEMIDPDSTTWPLVLNAVNELLE